MAVFLKVLIIIGKILLYILLAALLIVFLVLFFPISYKAKGTYKNNILSYSFRAIWLFRLLSFTVSDSKGMRLKLLCFNLMKEEKETDEATAEKAVPCEEALNNLSDSQEEISDFDDMNISVPEKNEDMSDNNESCSDCPDCSEKSEPSKKEKKDSSNSSLYDRIKKYIEIIKTERFKKAFSTCKKYILGIVVHILPRKWEINGTIGFDDPSVTGQILAITGMAYPIIGKHIHVRGDFDNNIIDVDGYAKGHIVLIKILVLGGLLYFNRNVRRVLKMFREDKNV